MITKDQQECLYKLHDIVWEGKPRPERFMRKLETQYKVRITTLYKWDTGVFFLYRFEDGTRGKVEQTIEIYEK